MDNVLSEIDGLQEVDSDVVEDDEDSSSEEGEQWSYVNTGPGSASVQVSQVTAQVTAGSRGRVLGV